MLLKEIKLTDINPKNTYNILVPIGSTEQHGPYIPYGSDTYMTDTAVEAISEVFPDMLILPTLEYSCSKEHRGFEGTIWLEEKTFKAILEDVCSSVKNIASSIIFFTGHGGNLHGIDEFISQHDRNFNSIPLYHLQWDDKAIDEAAAKVIRGPIDGHAGNSEISLLLSLKPKLTTIPRASDPKTPVSDGFETGRLKDKSKDGVSDPHPEWIVNKKLGDQLAKIMKETAVANLKKILEGGS